LIYSIKFQVLKGSDTEDRRQQLSEDVLEAWARAWYARVPPRRSVGKIDVDCQRDIQPTPGAAAIAPTGGPAMTKTPPTWLTFQGTRPDSSGVAFTTLSRAASDQPTNDLITGSYSWAASVSVRLRF
jgi:hypothetical protein